MAHTITTACVGCGACARLCPVLAITGERGKQHVVNEKRCVDCGVCGRVCPKGAITDETGKVCAVVKRSEWKRPSIDTELCSACGLCVSVCTAEALSIAYPRYRGDFHVTAILSAEKKCVGCGLCEQACPLEAITLHLPEAAAQKEV